MQIHSSTPEISIVVPFRDEGPNLRPLLLEISRLEFSEPRKLEVLLVDDASADDCGRNDPVFQSGRPAVRWLSLSEHAGQSAAMHAGIQAATGQWVVTMDADLQNDPADIPRMLFIAEQGDYDLVTGWRRNKCESFARRLSSSLANAVRRVVVGDPARDAGCTLKVMKKSFAKKLPNWDGMHRFIPSYAAIWVCRQTEVEVNHRRRLHGRSKVRHFSRAFSAFRGLLRVKKEKDALATANVPAGANCPPSRKICQQSEDR